MQALSSKEFFEHLNSNNLKPSVILEGIVKKSENSSEVMFSRKGEFGNWIRIPSSLIGGAFVLKTFVKDSGSYAEVKLQLAPPSNPESKALFDLLALASLKKKAHCSWKDDDDHWNWEHNSPCDFEHCEV
jgi:hypothetical protein